MKNDSHINTDFPSFQKGGWGDLKMPSLISCLLLPSPPPPFEIERTKSRTLTFEFRIISLEPK